MTIWKFVDEMTRPKLRLLEGPAPTPKFFWQRQKSAGADQRAPLPEVGELVRLQTGAVSDLGVYFAKVKSIGARRIVLQMEDETQASEVHAGASTGLALSNKTAVLVTYDRGEALYHFQTFVAGDPRDSEIIVSRPREVTRVQRRNYYRLPLQAPTTFRLLEPDDRAIMSSPMAARLVNLSGGGAMVSTNKPIAAGTRALVRVPTGKDGAPLDVVAETLDCRSTTQGRSSAYLIRFRFFGSPTLTAEDRESIISYIYEQQRILLKLRRMLRQTA